MPESSDVVRRCKERYWRSNVRLMLFLLAIWALVGLGCGVLWADWLNQWSLGGVPMGFWFAQQGSIATFVVIIFVYAILMNHLDNRYHREVKGAQGGQSQSQSQGGDA